VAALGRPPVVLLAEDNPTNQFVFVRMLKGAPITVEIANDGREAVQRASQHAYDMIFMDMRMPEMDGLEATRRIRAFPTPHGRVPILALTAGVLPEDIAECEAAGMDGLVAKPVEYTKLMQTIADTVGARQPGWGTNGTASSQIDLDAASPLPLDHAVLDRLLT
jgi:CheY-like chemotaxis protein